MINSIYNLFLTALAACLLQNVVFCGGYGVSEMLRLSMRPKYFGFVGCMVFYLSVVIAVITHYMDTYISFFKFGDLYIKCAEYGGVLLLVYLLTVCVMHFVLHLPQHYIKRTSVAAFNTLVFAVPFLNDRQNYTLSGAVGNAAGCAVAFVLAALLVSTSAVCVDNERMPNAFKGIPALFIFVGILSLAFMGFGA